MAGCGGGSSAGTSVAGPAPAPAPVAPAALESPSRVVEAFSTLGPAAPLAAQRPALSPACFELRRAFVARIGGEAKVKRTFESLGLRKVPLRATGEQIAGPRATVTAVPVAPAAGTSAEPQSFSLVLTGGRWRIDCAGDATGAPSPPPTP